jgi:tetratricopeptide (TPR) repeat protein
MRQWLATNKPEMRNERSEKNLIKNGLDGKLLTMKKKLLILILLIPATSWAAYPPKVEKELVARAMGGQQMIFARDYPKALELFQKLEKEFPDHPIGYFGQMAVLEMRMLEREDFHLGKQFEAMAKKGRKAVTRIRGQKPSDWDLLVCGSLLGLEGFYYARRSKWWDAYTRGVKSRQTFKTIIKRNPNFTDAYFGTGMYLYWRSVFRKRVKFLRIFPDKREEGIAIVKRVAANGHFAKDLAEVNLGMIWLEEKQYDKAHVVFKKFSDRYPKNVLLYLFDGRSLLAGKKYDSAIEVFRKLKKVDPSIVQTYYFIGLARVLQKNPKHYDEAERELKEFVKRAPSNWWKASGYYMLGRLAELRKDKVLAKKYYELAIKKRPDLKKAKIRLRGLGTGL